ncbi:bifunctional RecB family nuclease/DEAD/DEAH box helicase [Canibacter zhoujuaniae]|uniref:bifunctional RecB family nuclease/DEAD/DEAH box helicase n=1 Tax=Canibacter zhoujuaniae TaxID=2708343 RepID=UPI0014218675|nr:AAA domain-containing protein [Canibacter zhoujuaniae]
MQINGTQIVITPSDLSQFLSCEFATLRRFDALLGRLTAPAAAANPIAQLAAKLGEKHEEAVLKNYQAHYGDAVVDMRASIDGANAGEADWEGAVAQTRQVLAGDAQVVYQAVFYAAEPPRADGLQFVFRGLADFLIKTPAGWEVQDTKLTTKSKVAAVFQMLAYAEQLEKSGVATAPTVRIMHGNRDESVYLREDLALTYGATVSRFHDLLAQRYFAGGGDSDLHSAPPLEFADNSSDISYCLTCEYCLHELQQCNDVGLLAPVSVKLRERLAAVGIHSIAELAAADFSSRRPAADKAWQELFVLKGPKQLQVIQRYAVAAVTGQNEVQNPLLQTRLGRIGAASPVLTLAADSFYFDDPKELYTATTEFIGWALLATEAGEQEFFASTRKSERVLWSQLYSAIQRATEGRQILLVESQAVIDTLVRLAARHSSQERGLLWLLEQGKIIAATTLLQHAVIAPVREFTLLEYARAFRVLEALDAETNASTVQQLESLPIMRAAWAAKTGLAVTNVREHVRRGLRLQTTLVRHTLAAAGGLQHSLGSAATDNQTLNTPQTQPGAGFDAAALTVFMQTESEVPELDEAKLARREKRNLLRGQLLEAAAVEGLDPEIGTTLTMIGNSYDFYDREDAARSIENLQLYNSTTADWSGAFIPLVSRTDADLVCEPGRSGWAQVLYPMRTDQTWTAGELLNARVRAVFPAGSGVGKRFGSFGAEQRAATVTIESDGSCWVRVNERANSEQLAALSHCWPVAIDTTTSFSRKSHREAIEDWWNAHGEQIAAGAVPDDAGYALVSRALPRFKEPGFQLPEIKRNPDSAENPYIEPLVRSVAQLDSSVLAVQGPPGTGKSTVTAAVIARLVNEHGFKIAVTAQSHRVIESLLNKIVDSGVPTARVLKPLSSEKSLSEEQRLFTGLNRMADFLLYAPREGGFVFGGTSWNMGSSVLEKKSFDLLVVDEAGQFSIVDTLASLYAAKNLLAVGDPQQLPQVSGGVHPAPVDASVLGWLVGDAPVISQSRGYLLEHSWRMNPALCSIVSDLYYGGKLQSAPGAKRPGVVGSFAQGLYFHPVESQLCTTHNPHEAERVVGLVREMLRAKVVRAAASAANTATAEPLTQEDIIVVAPYNRQVALISGALQRAGFNGVAVGTVDKFQGQEALMAIVSLAASSPKDVDRGIEFLLSKNRLNVAISRAKWSAHIVASPQLEYAVPTDAEQLMLQASYQRLLSRASRVS